MSLRRWARRGAAALLLGAMASPLVAGPLVCGHRGTGKSVPGNPYPENSLPSIRAAFAEGADLVEVDVQLDRDGVAVLWHDPEVEVRGRRRRVEEVRHAAMPRRPGPGGVGVPVPTLRDALRVALELAPHLRAMDVELKVHRDEERRPLVREVAEVLAAEGAVGRVVVSSFDSAALWQLEALAPGVVTGFLHRSPETALEEVRRRNVVGPYRIEWVLSGRDFPSAGMRPEDLVRGARALGLKVGVWTVNRRWELWRLERAGVSMLITDEPDRARELFPRD